MSLESGLTRIDYVQFLVRNPHFSPNPRTFRSFLLSRREHLFKGWKNDPSLGALNYCLNCGAEDTEDNPITKDHMIPQVMTKFEDPVRQRLKVEVIGYKKNHFSLCAKCHLEIDSQKIPTLGTELPQNPSELFDFLSTRYPITDGNNRFEILLAAQNVIDRYIHIIEGYLSDDHSAVDSRVLQPFIQSLPNAYRLSGILYRQRLQLQSELDEQYADLVQSIA